MDTEDSQTLENIWTPNMRYYVWPNYNDLIPMARCMFKVLKSLLRDSNNDFGLTIKYKSVSRHYGLYQKLSLERVYEVENFMTRFDWKTVIWQVISNIWTYYWNKLLKKAWNIDSIRHSILITRGKSLLELWDTTFLPDWQPPLIFVWFTSKSHEH